MHRTHEEQHIMNMHGFEADRKCSYLGAGRFDGANYVGFHTHEGLELIAVKDGACSIDIGEFVLPGEPGDLFVIPPAALHNQRNHGHTTTIYATFQVSPMIMDSAPRTLNLGLDCWAIRWLEDLCRLSDIPGQPVQAVGDGLAGAIIHWLTARERGASTGHEGLDRAVRLLESDVGAAHTVESLAQAACVSAGRLISLFRTHLGMSPIRYLQNRRIALAKQLLHDPYLTIAQAGRRCGYEDHNYFSRLFRKRCGCSPGAYRRESRAREGSSPT